MVIFKLNTFVFENQNVPAPEASLRKLGFTCVSVMFATIFLEQGRAPSSIQ